MKSKYSAEKHQSSRHENVVRDVAKNIEVSKPTASLPTVEINLFEVIWRAE